MSATNMEQSESHCFSDYNDLRSYWSGVEQREDRASWVNR
jgi:hypothetical protein